MHVGTDHSNSGLTLPQESKNGLVDICQFGDESTDVLKSTKETSDLSLNPQSRHVKYGYDLFRINLYTMLADDMPQQIPISYPKGLLLGI